MPFHGITAAIIGGFFIAKGKKKGLYANKKACFQSIICSNKHLMKQRLSVKRLYRQCLKNRDRVYNHLFVYSFLFQVGGYIQMVNHSIFIIPLG